MLEKDNRGRDGWRLLRWQMTVERAKASSQANMKAVKMVPGTGGDRCLIESSPSGGVMRAFGLVLFLHKQRRAR